MKKYNIRKTKKKHSFKKKHSYKKKHSFKKHSFKKHSFKKHSFKKKYIKGGGKFSRLFERSSNINIDKCEKKVREAEEAAQKKAKAEVETVQEKAKAEAVQAKAEAETAKAEAVQAKAEVETAKAEAAQARAKVAVVNQRMGQMILDNTPSLPEPKISAIPINPTKEISTTLAERGNIEETKKKYEDEFKIIKDQINTRNKDYYEESKPFTLNEDKNVKQSKNYYKKKAYYNYLQMINDDKINDENSIKSSYIYNFSFIQNSRLTEIDVFEVYVLMKVKDELITSNNVFYLVSYRKIEPFFTVSLISNTRNVLDQIESDDTLFNKIFNDRDSQEVFEIFSKYTQIYNL